MFNRNERERARMTEETAPYRQMAVDLEVENVMQTHSLELATANRHLLTSNDRYQLSAVHLHTARNRYILANSVAQSVSADSKEPTQSIALTTEFVKSAYKSSKDSFETAEQISAHVGFQAGIEDLNAVSASHDAIAWPNRTDVSYNFTLGLLSGVDVTGGYVLHHYESTLESKSVPNDFKRRLKTIADPLFASIDAKRKAIDRVGGSGLSAISPRETIAEVYEHAKAMMKSIDKISEVLAMPRIYDQAFSLKEPYDETRPERREFNPSALGTPAVRETVAKPDRPAKPFSASILGSPNIPSPPISPPKKPFNPDVLGRPAVPPEAQKPAPSRPFDPTALGGNSSAPPNGKREFNPSILEPKKTTD